MRDNSGDQRKTKITTTKVLSNQRLPDANDPNSDIKKQLQQLKKYRISAQQQLLRGERQLKMQHFRNQKLKAEFAEYQKNWQTMKKKYVQKLHETHKDNKQSPLFYNQHGLCPFQLMQLEETKYAGTKNNICMVCFLDLQPSVKVITLPCHHIIHKQCAIQNLLYSKICPACNEIVIFSS